jgi:cyclopropane fatty-acyl-phospholipid synthase-like methyltransferase
MDTNLVRAHYEECFFGANTVAQQSGWKNSQSQDVRLQVLARSITGCQAMSVLDFGCGLGRLIDILREQEFNGHYLGLDLSSKIIGEASEKYKNDSKAIFKIGDSKDLVPADMIVSSGLFNVKLDHSDHEWENYVKDSILEMWHKCIVGIGFNLLSTMSDLEKRSSNLWYSNPSAMLEWCLENVSSKVRVDHSYGLWDYTISILH